jgi:hypothetical protein
MQQEHQRASTQKNRRLAQGSKKLKIKAHIKPALAHAAENLNNLPQRQRPRNSRIAPPQKTRYSREMTSSPSIFLSLLAEAPLRALSLLLARLPR